MMTHKYFVSVILLIFTIMGIALTPLVVSAQADAQARANKRTIFVPAVYRPHAGIPKVEEADFTNRTLQRVNMYRKDAGCGPLAIDQRLNRAALRHSRDMAYRDFFGHKGSDGSMPWDRIDQEGYRWSRIAENIGAGFTNPERAVDAWMDSEGHRRNLLNCDLKHMGVGYFYFPEDNGNITFKHYWTQKLAAPLD